MFSKYSIKNFKLGFLFLIFFPLASALAADTYRIEITNVRSRLKADVIWASTNPYQGVFLWPDNTSASQEFDLLDSGNGFFRIRARHSGQCLMLDWRQGSYNGTNIIQYPFCGTGYTPAEWRRAWVNDPVICNSNICTTSSGSLPVLVNRFSGKCLDARNPFGGAPGQQAILQQWDCVRTTKDWNIGNQAWGIAFPGQVEYYF
jgi:Ricin-type beta-trefoil lectin domain-like